MEDQHYNGDIWNHEIVQLFEMFGWHRIGDFDMDVVGSDDNKMGIDTLVSFETPLKSKPQLAILEAKRYLTSSFSKSLLQEWLGRLDTKLLRLRNSDKFYDKFPGAGDCTIPDTGVIAIWFSDTDNYKSFHPKFLESLRQVSISNRQRKAGMNKIYVMDNERFMRLFALQSVVRSIDNNENLSFAYSPRFNNEEPFVNSKCLTIECMFSDVIFAERQVKTSEGSRSTSYIFYFGDLNYNSFKLLKSAFSKTVGWNREKAIVLYVYDADSDFRKIENDIKERVFESFQITIKHMVRNSNIPDYILNEEC